MARSRYRRRMTDAPDVSSLERKLAAFVEALTAGEAAEKGQARAHERAERTGRLIRGTAGGRRP